MAFQPLPRMALSLLNYDRLPTETGLAVRRAAVDDLPGYDRLSAETRSAFSWDVSLHGICAWLENRVPSPNFLALDRISKQTPLM